jgi:hypothetical protein
MGVLALIVAFHIQSLLEEFVGEDASLRETIHAHSYLDIHPSLRVDESAQVVLDLDFVGDEVQPEPHVLEVGHGSHEVEVGEVDAIEMGLGRRDGRVDEKLGCDKVGSGCAFVACVNDAVTTHGEACPVLFVFLRTKRANNTALRRKLVFGDIGFGDEETCVGAFDVMNALEEAPEFLAKLRCHTVLCIADLMRWRYSSMSPVSLSTTAPMKLMGLRGHVVAALMRWTGVARCWARVRG